MANPLTDIPEEEPEELVIGDTFLWKRTDLGTDYPNSSYTAALYARLEGSGSTTFNISATNDGADYKFTKAAATTAGYTAGRYHWDLKLTRTSDSAVVTVDSGTFELIASKATSTADPRSHAKTMLDKIESILEGRADSDVSSYSIQGRSLTKIPVSELMTWRAKYKAEYASELKAEAAANGKGAGNTILYRFT